MDKDGGGDGQGTCGYPMILLKLLGWCFSSVAHQGLVGPDLESILVTLLGLLSYAELWASCPPLERPCVQAVSQ